MHDSVHTYKIPVHIYDRTNMFNTYVALIYISFFVHLPSYTCQTVHAQGHMQICVMFLLPTYLDVKTCLQIFYVPIHVYGQALCVHVIRSFNVCTDIFQLVSCHDYIGGLAKYSLHSPM